MSLSIGSIVVVDDSAEMREMLHDFLRGEGHRVVGCASGREAFDLLNLEGEDNGRPSYEVDLLLSDVKMGEIDGLELLERMRKRRAETPVIMVTGYASIDSAVEAMRHGAYDYLTKPFDFERLGHAVRRALDHRRLLRDNALLRAEMRMGWGLGGLIGKSPAMKKLFDLLPRVASCTSNVLISGESGTGKELVARTLHQLGPRSLGPFVAINCAAIPDTLLESELFGHVRGSFTGASVNKKGLIAEADGGVLFLDEIGDMPLSLQAKLLRVLQERKIRPVGDVHFYDVDVRILAATHQDLRKAARERRFREDLFYRLSVIPIQIPPLRERLEDLPLLADHFLQKYIASRGDTFAEGKPVFGLNQSALAKLMRMSWPGNVRELENIIERSIVLSQNSYLEESDIPDPESVDLDDLISHMASDLPSLEELEERYIQLVLQRTGGRKDKTAAILGINRRTLYRREQAQSDPDTDVFSSAAVYGEGTA